MEALYNYQYVLHSFYSTGYILTTFLPLLFSFLQNPDNQTAPANRETQTSNHRPMVSTRVHVRMDSNILAVLTYSNNEANTLTEMFFS